MDTAVETAIITAPTLAADAPLNATDRCDRCPAQAYVRATFREGGEIILCGHHANSHRAALLVAGAYLHDETDRLTARPTVTD